MTNRKLTLKSCAVRGPAGKSAYEVAVAEGYTGTAEEYNAMLASVPEYFTKNFGAPIPVELAANMTDTNAVYLYVGSEDGYSYGFTYAFISDAWQPVNEYGAVTPSGVADAASAWLGENITNPDSPPLDTSLSVANAAADSKTVGDTLATGVMLRNTLAANTDMDTVTQPGIYYKGPNTALVNAPTDSTSPRVRIVVYGGGGGTSVVQVWHDTAKNESWHRMKSASGNAWLAWKKSADVADIDSAIANALTQQPALAADTDMDSVVTPGMYYKAANVAIVNAPADNARRARVLVFSGGTETSVVQLWCDCYSNQIWHRMKSASLSDWSSWIQIVDTVDLDNALANALLQRPTIAENTDMNTVITPGMYYKGANVTLVNAPDDNASRARIVVYGGGGETSVVQLWCDTLKNKIWHRMKSGSLSAWSTWVCDANSGSSSGDRYPGAVFSRTVQVYDALDELETAYSDMITHTDLTASLDSTDLPEGETADDNKMRLYKIDTTPAHMVTGGYTISNTPSYPKPKALIICCQHGDEKASANYIIDFIKRIFTDQDFQPIASAVEWHIVPVVNVWGFNHNTRNNAPTESNDSGYNINRDYSDHEYTYSGKAYGFKTVEAQTIKQLYLDNVYAFFLDVHQAHFSGNTTVCGFTSIPNLDPDRLTDYKKLWRAIEKAGCTAQIWAKNDPATVKTNAQIAFNWGNIDDPAVGSNAAASAPSYVRGNAYWNAHVSEQHPVFCAGTVETEKSCDIISGSSTYYNRIAMSFGAVYVEAVIKELVSTVLDHFDVYN